MKQKRYSEGQIIKVLREAEVPGVSIGEVCRRNNITDVTFFRWRNKYGGLAKADMLKHKALESENAGLKRLVAEQMLVIERLKEFSRKKKMSSPVGRRQALEAMSSRGVSERAARRYLGFSRRVSGYDVRQSSKDRAPGDRLIGSSQQLPRFGYRRTALWLDEGLSRVRRLWKRLDL